MISEGGNRIASSYLVYNIKEQRIKAESSAGGDERVKITYTPNGGANQAVEALAEPDSGEATP